MGHERIGYLPKSQKWTSIVKRIEHFSPSSDDVSDIASETLKNVRTRIQFIQEDSGVISAFKFLVLIAHASRLSDPSTFLKTKGIVISNEFDIFELTSSSRDFVDRNQDSKEYSTFAMQSLIDTIGDWSKRNDIQPSLLFDSKINSFDLWRKAADGRGFCDLSRTFFSKFTERYLKYFLEREASSRIHSLYERQLFMSRLEEHVEDISQHAFETAKIVQSLSAGWFNKKGKDKSPSDAEIKGFISHAFKKIKSELLREGDRE